MPDMGRVSQWALNAITSVLKRKREIEYRKEEAP